MSTATTLTLERFSSADRPALVACLSRIWGAAYGATGCPVFTNDYLAWLYGDPRTRVMGLRAEGSIVALKAYLARDLWVQGQIRRGSLSTHLAIDPALPLGVRLQIAQAFTLEAWRQDWHDVSYAVFEAGKGIVSPTQRLLATEGIVTTTGTFAQAIAAPPRSHTPIQRATTDDAPFIAALAQETAQAGTFGVWWTPETIAQHWFTAPRGEVYRTEDSALCLYTLQTVQNGCVSTVAVCEGLLIRTPEAGIALLCAAVDYARRQRAKGVVCENVSHLPDDLQRACGLRPSLRRMTLSVMSREAIELGSHWAVDVK